MPSSAFTIVTTEPSGEPSRDPASPRRPPGSSQAAGTHTTNAIESLNHSLRKVLKPRGAFPDDGAILKLLYLALTRVAKRWTRPVRDWTAALNTFAVLFPDRIPQ